MLILAVDTAGPVCSVAVSEDLRVLSERQHPNARDQAKLLVPMINDALEDAGRAFNELDLLAVNVGPGSFTGLRIGLATVRALSLALADLPVMGVTAFDLYADGVIALRDVKADEKILVAIESMRADLFFQVFNADGTPGGAPFNCAPEDTIEQPGVANEAAMLVTGDAHEKLRDTLWKASYVDDDDVYESAANIAQLAFRRIEAGAKPGSEMPAPLYLRPPDVTMPKDAPGKQTEKQA